MISVVTYNLLSPNLCINKYFPYCSKEALDTEKRMSLIQGKLTCEIGNNSIICLQEVSESWCCQLKIFFDNLKYDMIYRLYGNNKSGNMGIVVAYPREKYNLVRVSMERIANHYIEPMVEEYDHWMDQLIWKYGQKFLNYVWFGGSPPETTPDIIKKKPNVLLMLELNCKENDKNFICATYHMPCVYWNEEVMLEHAEISCCLVRDFALDLPTIFCGDFNSIPKSHVYNLITRDIGFESASEQYFREEPLFTNYVKNKKSGFKNTLDYIFIDGFSVVNMNILPPSTEFLGESLPTTFEPSDHLLLSALLEF